MNAQKLLHSALFIGFLFITQLFYGQIIKEIKVIKAECNETKSKVIFYRLQRCTIDISTSINGVLHLTQVSLNGSSMIDTLKLIPGTYFFNSRNEYNQQSNQVIVGKVEPLKIITNQKNNVVCEGDHTKLSVPFAKKYLWSTGDTTAEIYVTKAGKYSVRIIDPKEKTCSLNDTIEISLNPKLIVDVLQYRTNCENDCSTNVKFVPIGGTGPYLTNYWPERICFEGCKTKADSAQNQCYNPSGWTVSVTDSKGCNIEKLYHVLPNSKNLKIKKSKPLTLCEGDSVTLSIDKSENSNYQWYLNGEKINNSDTNQITVYKSGKYTLEITYQSCVLKSDTVNVTINKILLLRKNDKACLNHEIEIITDENKVNYEWKIPNQIKDIDYSISSGGTDTSSNIIIKWMTPGSKEITINYTNGICLFPYPKKIELKIYDSIQSILITSDSILNLCKSDSLKLGIQNKNYNSIQWFLNNEKIINSDSIFYAKVPGNYSVELTNQGDCLYRSKSLKIIKENCADLKGSKLEYIYIYPNPAKNIITIRGYTSEKVYVELFNALGQIVLNTSLNDESISVEHFPKGIYTITIYDDTKKLLHREKVTLN